MDKRISELDPGSALDGTELLPMAQGAGTDAMTVSTTPLEIGDYVLGRLAAGSGVTIVVDTDGVATITASGTGGTVTHTGGDLTANAVVLGAGTADTKVVSGIATDGTSALNLGVAGASVGKVVLANATSGSITLQPPTGALGTITLTTPAASGTLALTSQIGTAGALASDTDGTLTANSDARIATQKAVKTYVDSQITGGATDVMLFKGVIDCSANPNYPAADAGNLYKVSVAGKIGGASGPNVEAGDTVYCITDSTASGNHATVGANWVISQVNVDGAVIGPASATDLHLAVFDGTTGKIIKDGGAAPTGSNTGDETGARVATLLHAASNKTSLVDADEVNGTDSASSFGLIRTTWANVKAFLKTYFDTLYAPISQPIVVVPFFPGAPTSSQLLGIFPAPAGITTITFAAALSGAAGKALTAATAQTDIDVRKNATTSANGTSVGTIRFAAAGTVPTFIAASGFTLAGGTDYLTIWAPASPDATLANFAVALYATRS